MELRRHVETAQAALASSAGTRGGRYAVALGFGLVWSSGTGDQGAAPTPRAANDAGMLTDSGPRDQPTDSGSLDATAPTVSSTSPASNATDVALSPTIEVTFSEAMAAPPTGAITVESPIAGPVEGTLEATTADVWTFFPTQSLVKRTRYTVTVSAAAESLGGNRLSAAYSWTFDTQAAAWGTAQVIESDDAGHADSPQIAFDPAGNAIAVWAQADGIRYNIWANRYVVGAGWATAELIESDAGDAGGLGGPQIAFDSAGNAIAVWHQYDGTRHSIWANRYMAGSGWATSQLIESEAGDAGRQQIAVDSAGNAIAVWSQDDGSRSNIWANRYVTGSGWATAQLIQSDSAAHASAPQIAVDPAGNAIAVWRQDDGSRSNIWANRFE